MSALRVAISPNHLDQKKFKALVDGKLGQIVPGFCPSYFLEYLYHEQSPDAEDVLCDFFHSKHRACEYYLGECKSHIFEQQIDLFLKPSSSNEILDVISALWQQSGSSKFKSKHKEPKSRGSRRQC